MSVLVDKNTRLLVQGFTGKEGTFHAAAGDRLRHQRRRRRHAGQGRHEASGPARLQYRGQAVKETGANATVIFVPPPFAADAIMEAADAGIALIVCITEGIPVIDMVKAWKFLQGKNSRLIGPNCPGVISPGKCKIGIMPGHIHLEGNVGVVSRSGTLTYEAVGQLTKLGIGQSTCIGIGGDPIIGTTFLDAIQMFDADPDTHAIVMIGEIGGNAEETAAAYIGAHVKKPVVGFIAGQTAPPGRRMGHAGAIISGGSGAAAGQDQRHGSGGHYGVLVARANRRKHSEDDLKNKHAENIFHHQTGRGGLGQGGQDSRAAGRRRVSALWRCAC